MEVYHEFSIDPCLIIKHANIVSKLYIQSKEYKNPTIIFDAWRIHLIVED